MRTIIEFISTAFQAFISLIANLFHGIELVTKSANYTTTFTTLMPEFLATCFALFMGVYLIKFLLSR